MRPILRESPLFIEVGGRSNGLKSLVTPTGVIVSRDELEVKHTCTRCRHIWSQQTNIVIPIDDHKVCHILDGAGMVAVNDIAPTARKSINPPARCPSCKTQFWNIPLKGGSHQCHCLRCGADWIARIPNPGVCSRC